MEVLKLSLWAEQTPVEHGFYASRRVFSFLNTAIGCDDLTRRGLQATALTFFQRPEVDPSSSRQ